MLKHSTSLATLFGRSVCPLFLATALVVAPGVANAQNVTIDNSDNLNETNGDWPGGTNELTADGGTLTVEEGVTMNIDEDGAGLSVDGWADVVITNNGSIYTTGTANNYGYTVGHASYNQSAVRSFGYGDAISVWNATNAIVINNGLIDVGDFNAAATALFYADNSLNINNGVIALRYEEAYGLFTSRSDAATLVNNSSIYSYSESGTRLMRIAALDPNAASNLQADAAKTGHLMVNNGLLQAWKGSGNSDIRAMELEGFQTEATALNNGLTIPLYADDDLNRYIVDAAMYNYGTINIIATTPTGTSTSRSEVAGMYVNAHDVDAYNFGSIYIGSIGIGMEMQGSGLRQYNYGNIVIDAANAGSPADPSINPISAGIESFLSRAIYDYADPLPGSGAPSVDDLNILRDNASSYRNLVVNAGLIQINNDRDNGMSAGIITRGGSGHDVYNYGEIRTPNGWSILYENDGQLGVNGYNNTYLFDGSILVGDLYINPTAKNWNRFHLGDGYNAALQFDVSWGKFVNGVDGPNVNLIYSPNGLVLLNDTIYTFDLESYAQQDQAAWSLVSMIQNTVDEETASRLPSGDFGFNGDGEAGLSNKWARMFTGWVQEEGDGAVVVGDDINDERDGGYSGYSAGTIVGVNKPDRSYFFGAAYGYLESIDEMDNDTGYDTHSATLFGGVAGTFKDRFDLSLIAGLTANHTQRDVADNRVLSGIDTVDANYGSVFLSPSLLVDGPWGSSLRLNYLGKWTQSHTYELYGGEDLKVDQRFTSIVGTQFQMTHDIPMMQNVPLIGAQYRARVRYGVEGHYAFAPDIRGTVTLGGLPKTGPGLATPYDDGFSARGYAGLDIGPVFFEAGYTTDEQVSVNAGLKIRF
ncbi:hypothetical protein [Roseibium sp.]|uniref:hypothetical protein n=1 Tax=Roseibium sp. TaxID=1936156 RepID=UPI003BAA4596